ncbi:fibrillin-1-like [Physella acuta]|uniref:fibrillin-1-like n=1 Tax=Physella acuta TaxID=109671 RepID=UPI0027DC2E0B|nr:fibrillin-1-like [Physella acuta]
MKFSKVSIAAILFMCISYAQAKCFCEQITTVVNGQVVSSCKPFSMYFPAFFSSGKDIDECKDEPYLCEQVCTNTNGGYTCSCNAGYAVWKVDTRRCVDIDECSAQPSPCEHICINTDGNFTCLCKPGFDVNSKDRTKCDARPDYVSPYDLCVPLSSEIIKTRSATSALNCYSACRAEHCYSFKFANGLCTTKLYAGNAVDLKQDVVAGSFLSCYNDYAQCTLYSDVDSYIPRDDKSHEDCFNYCRGNYNCIGYHYYPNPLCIITYPIGSSVDIKNIPVDTFVYLKCDK